MDTIEEKGKKTFAQKAILEMAEKRTCNPQDYKFQHHRDYAVKDDYEQHDVYDNVG